MLRRARQNPALVVLPNLPRQQQGMLPGATPIAPCILEPEPAACQGALPTQQVLWSGGEMERQGKEKKMRETE